MKWSDRKVIFLSPKFRQTAKKTSHQTKMIILHKKIPHLQPVPCVGCVDSDFEEVLRFQQRRGKSQTGSNSRFPNNIFIIFLLWIFYLFYTILILFNYIFQRKKRITLLSRSKLLAISSISFRNCSVWIIYYCIDPVHSYDNEIPWEETEKTWWW